MTSSSNISGPMVFKYIEANGQRTDVPTHVPMIHGLGTSFGAIGNANGTTEHIPQKLSFFVGTKEQWEEQQVP